MNRSIIIPSIMFAAIPGSAWDVASADPFSPAPAWRESRPDPLSSIRAYTIVVDGQKIVYEVDESRATFSLTAPEKITLMKSGQSAATAVKEEELLYPSYLAAREAPSNQGMILPSVELCGQRGKFFDDGMYGALELRLETNGKFSGSGKRRFCEKLAEMAVAKLAAAPLEQKPAWTAAASYAVAAAKGGALALVSCRLASIKHLDAVAASEVTVLDPALGRVVARETLASAHLSEGIAFVPSRSWALTPLVKVRNLVPITQVAKGWVMSSGLAVSDLQGQLVQIPLDEANDYFADPSAIVADAAGRRAYVASGGSDVVSVVDLERLAAWLANTDAQTKHEAIEDLTLSPEYVIARIPTARNPRQLALSPDSKLLFVAEHLEDSVLVVDTTTLQPLGRIILGDAGLNDPIRRGERVFTKAAHTFQREFSCRSCHPDAHVDGLAYDFDGDGIGDNLLDNRSLQGLAGTAPFKWNGKNSTLQMQCGPRFARVLMRTDPIPPQDLNDLVTFLEAQPPSRTVHKSQLGKLTEAQELGRQIFFAAQQPDGTPIPVGRQCHTCHRPPLFTNRLPSDIGSKGPLDSTNFFDTPHLLGVASTAPYLHDGRAKTLEELWTVYQTNDMHGVSSYMNKHQLNNLIEFLKTL